MILYFIITISYQMKQYNIMFYNFVLFDSMQYQIIFFNVVSYETIHYGCYISSLELLFKFNKEETEWNVSLLLCYEQMGFFSISAVSLKLFKLFLKYDMNFFYSFQDSIWYNVHKKVEVL